MCEFIKEKVEMETPTAVVGVFFVFLVLIFVSFFSLKPLLQLEDLSKESQALQKQPAEPHLLSLWIPTVNSSLLKVKNIKLFQSLPELATVHHWFCL